MAKLVECKSCKHTVDQSAKTCPSCGVSKPGANRSNRQWVFLAIFLVISIPAVKYGNEHKLDAVVKTEQPTPEAAAKNEQEKQAQEKQEDAERSCKDSIMAQVMAKEFVKKSLKSPSTADFPFLADSVVYLGECTHIIKSHVDAQNSFGAMLRHETIVKLRYDKASNMWIPIEIKV